MWDLRRNPPNYIDAVFVDLSRQLKIKFQTPLEKFLDWGEDFENPKSWILAPQNQCTVISHLSRTFDLTRLVQKSLKVFDLKWVFDLSSKIDFVFKP